MAVITVIAARNMCWVLADGGDAVVARAAAAKHLGVIDS